MASLFVYMNGYEVGEYIQRRGGAQEFFYCDAWLEQKGAIPISLSLPLTDKIHKGDRVHNYFDNLLPDSTAIRSRLQTRFGVKTNRPFNLLSFIGRDCVGALQLVAERTDVDVKKIDGVPLADTDIADVLRNYRTMPLGMSRELEFRISLAGAQEKTALLWHDDAWQCPLGSTPTTHIFKLPIGKIDHSEFDLSDSVENEWLCMEIMRGFGLPVPVVNIRHFEEMKVLVVERFDRVLAEDKSWIIRQPVEDMCQANEFAAALKYESDGGPGMAMIMEKLKSSLQPEEDRRQFMRTVFLFWILGAIDGHAKNISIFLKAGGRFELTPVYDVLSAYPLAEKREIEYRDLKMAMALHSKNIHYHWHEMLPRHWFNQAKKLDFPGSDMEQIIEQTISNIDRVIDHVSTYLPADFPEDIADPVFNGMKNIAGKFE